MRHRLLAVVVGAVAWQGVAWAADVSWINPSGGAFSAPSNWSGGGPPGAADTAVFNLGSGGYTVTFTANVNNQQLRVGHDTVTLDLATRQYSFTAGGAGYALQVGTAAGQVGRLQVLGGTLSVSNSVFGNGAGAIGHGTLSAGARWTNNGSITIGESGSGTFTIHGTMTSSIGRIGRQAGATGTLIVDGPSASYATPGVGLLIGSIGSGTFLLRNGATFSDQGSFISGFGGPGFASISGGAVWNSVDGLYVGNQGAGTLLVTSGGRFVQSGSAFSTIAGVLGGSSGTINVNGAGSAMQLAAQLSIGNDGTGVLNLTAGGTISSARAGDDTHGYIGEGTSGIGTVTISGAASRWTGNGALAVGYLGRGTLLLSDQGSAQTASVTIGRFSSGRGFARVDGGATLSSTSGIFVGGSDLAGGGFGTLIFASGGAVAAGPILRAWEGGLVQWQNGGTLSTAAVELRGVMTMQAGNDKVLSVTSLEVDTGTNGALDINDNAAIVDYSLVSPLEDIRDDILAGRAGGAWTGPGIRSTVAAASSSFAVGYAEASELFASFPATFLGRSIDNTTVLVRGTLAGDANLDATVNLADFGRLAAHFNTSGRWSRGDFNFDGAVDLADFGLLAGNFNQSVTSVLPDAPAGSRAIGAPGQILPDQSARTLVPEPAGSAAVTALGLAPALRRRASRRW
ncbi:MAG: hypothetical protein NZ561_01470 [Phycisphaerae bacterium]|nr:hypothetical protein [Phycisphaerae bacterium]MDW8260883.1 hypothetical protein [Phycisphaerales bacterium]